MEPVLKKPPWKKHPGTWIIGFPTLQVTKEGHFLAGPGNLGYLGDLKKRERNSPKSISTTDEVR